jgi:hypothetical protein
MPISDPQRQHPGPSQAGAPASSSPVLVRSARCLLPGRIGCSAGILRIQNRSSVVVHAGVHDLDRWQACRGPPHGAGVGIRPLRRPPLRPVRRGPGESMGPSVAPRKAVCVLTHDPSQHAGHCRRARHRLPRGDRLPVHARQPGRASARWSDAELKRVMPPRGLVLPKTAASICAEMALRIGRSAGRRCATQKSRARHPSEFLFMLR